MIEWLTKPLTYEFMQRGLAASRFEQVLLLNHQVVAYGRVADVITPQALGQAFSGQVLMLPNGLALVDECCPPDEVRVV